MGNPAEFEHYKKYPMCGFCTNAWDIIYQRSRHLTSPVVWVGEYCPVGGCDPEVWDYLNSTTMWPKGFKVSKKTGMPNWDKLPNLPDHDDRVFHKRKTDGPNAKWRRTSNALLKKAIEAHEAFRLEDPTDRAEWDDEEDVTQPVDLADADIW